MKVPLPHAFALRAMLAALALLAAWQPATPAHAAETADRADVRLSRPTSNTLLDRLLPISLTLPGSYKTTGDGGATATAPAPATAWLTEARYCGAGDGGRGRVVGVVRWNDAAVTRTLRDGAHDCLVPLNEIAKRDAFASSGDAALVELFAGFSPGTLRIALGAMVTTATGGPTLGAALTRARAAGDLRVVDLAARPLALPQVPVQHFDIGLQFLKGEDGVSVTLVPTATATAASRGGRPLPPEPFAIADGTDAAIRATFPFVNRVLALLTQDGPLVVKVDRQVIELRALQVSGTDGRLLVRGRGTPRGLRESVQLTVDAAGPDLKVEEVRAAPELEDCGALSMLAALACRTRNAARSTAAATIASELTSRARGQTLRDLAPLSPSTIALGQRRLRVQLTPAKIQSTNTALSVAGKIDINAPP